MENILEQDVALVTGASRGIGKAIAVELGTKGAFVVGTATSDKGAEAITTWMEQENIRGIGMKLDVANQEEVTAIVKSISSEHGAITILVNNAGITRDNLLMRMKDDEWDSVINTNMSSIYRMSKAVLRGMSKARRGRIINIASVVGVMGNAGQTNYAAAKAGIIGFAKALAREVASRNVTVNSVAPGFIDTDMTRELPDAQKEALLNQIPAGRLGNADEIAAAVGFLASPAAAYITGETINVNGGMYMN